MIMDDRMEKPKAFQEIKHDHRGKSTRLQEKRCERCRYDTAEESLTAFIEEHKDTDKTTDNSTGAKRTYTFKSLVVHRGSFDDVMGWTILWS